MKQYKIIEASNRYDLEADVNDALKNDWKPQGGVSFIYSGFTECWVQAMVKE